MASTTTTIRTVPLAFQQDLRTSRQISVTSCHSRVLTCRSSTSIDFRNIQQYLCRSSHRRGLTSLPKRISASSSGLEASITDKKGDAIPLKNAKIVIESQDENKIQLRVEVTGDETQKVFDQAKRRKNIPGKWLLTIPKSFLLQILGEQRVTKFVIQEIVNSTMADFVEKENLNPST
ncbi:hypothetical protein SLA2020_388540 [Shorea laevis]